MRFWRQFGHRGRSIAEICDDDTGWYSGMMHRGDCLPNLPEEQRRWFRMPVPAAQAVVKTAHFEKHWEREVNGLNDGSR